MAFSGQVMLAEVDGGATVESQARLAIAGTPAQLWVEFDWMAPQATLDTWEADSIVSPDIVEFIEPGLGFTGFLCLFHNGVNWEWAAGSSTGGTVLGDTVYRIALHWNTTANTLSVTINGGLVFTDGDVLTTLGSIRLGISSGSEVAETYFDNVLVSSVGSGGGELLDNDFEVAIVPDFTSTVGDVSLVDDPFTPVPSPAGQRFYESPPCRYLVTNLQSETLTFLDHLARDRELTRTLNAPLTASGVVPSDNPEVNIEALDGDPFLNEGNRLLYVFFRENDTASSFLDHWVCRAGTIILEVEDAGGPNAPETRFVGYDPWQYLYLRPMVDASGDLPGERGFRYNAPGNEIALDLLVNTFAAHGEVHIDFGSGTFETTETVEIEFQQGISVGEAWDQLVDTGTLDIVLDPLYEPVVLPGIVAQLSIYERAGDIKREAIFAWDRPSRSVVNLNRKLDGNERANKVQYYIGQGGPPVPLQTSALGVVKYGEYWDQQFFPGRDSVQDVTAVAEAQKRLRRFGLTTYRISPAPERSPIPFVEYDIGDSVPIYASDRLRDPLSDLKRVYSIPLAIGNDQMVAPVQILVIDDEDTSS